MGGEIGVNSTPGRGSAFWFTLTLPHAPPAQPSSPALAALNILIADDNDIALEALRSTAATLGWSAYTVSSGEAAVERALNRGTHTGGEDAYILDWDMPGMDGLTAAKLIREVRPNQPEPIIVMVSGHAKGEMATAPGAEFADAFLSKPVTASSLYDAVVQALGRRQGTGVLTSITPRAVPRLMGVRALIVDDSDINLEVAQKILEAEGARIFLADSGQSAVDWMREHREAVDVVLMDLQMPGMDGLQATRTITQDHPDHPVPVIALSAGIQQAQQDAAQAAGMVAFIPKPFHVDTAVNTINRVLQRAAAAKSTDNPHTATPEADHWPGLDTARGTAIFGDADHYRQVLRRFARDYHGVCQTLQNAPAEQAADTVHKLKGAAANLGLSDVAHCAGAMVLNPQAQGAEPASLAALQRAMETALASIERYAPEAAPTPASDPANTDAQRVASLLQSALSALDQDRPDAIEPILTELRLQLGDAAVAALAQAVQSFDFRSAEAQVRQLATALQLKV